MADALVHPAVAATMYGLSAVTAGVAVKKINDEKESSKKLPVMGIMGAFIFATQMVNFTIPGTGSSGHLCGGVLASAILGPWAGFLTMIGVLLIQGLFFADGGLLAFGCNVWNMAFYGCFVSMLAIWKPLMKKNMNMGKIILASILGCVVALQLGAFSVVLQTKISGITALPFGTFVLAMQPIHLAIGLGEGLITSAVLCFVYKARPELLWGYNGNLEETAESKGKLSYKTTLIVLGVCALVIAGGLSLLASGNPDGLEWSILKLTGDTELAAEGSVYESAEALQAATSFMPDYAFKNSESLLGTTTAGITGGLIVFGIFFIIALISFGIKKIKVTSKTENIE